MAIPYTEIPTESAGLKVFRGVLKGIKKITLILACVYLAIFLLERILPPAPYRNLFGLDKRVVVWIFAELHLMFAAFVLGVPIFALIAEIIGHKNNDPKYDAMAKEFTKLLFLAFTATAVLGAGFLVCLKILYGQFTMNMYGVFSKTWVVYLIIMVLGEVVSAYLYWYAWDALQGAKKWIHITIGVFLNIFGTMLLLIANSWATFMMTPPPGVMGANGVPLVNFSVWTAITNYAWMPINIHRLIANVAFGGAIVAAYSAFKFLRATTDEERAHYDWMGYTGNFIAVCALIPLPFAGYWLGKEIYAYSTTMGVSMMGGIFSWLWIIQASLIGCIFLGANYYLWLGMQRIQGAERYRGAIIALLALVTCCFIVWATPHNVIMTREEAQTIGGAFHPIVGIFGVMSAKVTAANILILTTFLSFLLYRRANKQETVAWAPIGKLIQWFTLAAAAGTVIYLGVLGYFVESQVRVERLSPAQVLTVLGAMTICTVLDLFIWKNAKVIGEIQYGKMSPRSQYLLIFLAVSFTWLMGLMGYIRSALRQFWHVYGVMKDTSPQAYTPTVGFATITISCIVVIFFLIVSCIFWMADRAEKSGAGAAQGKGH